MSTTIAQLLHKIRPIQQEVLDAMPDGERNVFKNYKLFPIDLLVPAVWNYKVEDEFMSEQLLNNIRRNGQIMSCQVRPLPTGYYEVVDGNHRLQAFKKLEQVFVLAYDHGAISQAQAERIAIEVNETRFASDTDKLARIIQELRSEFDEAELTSTLPFTEDELSQIIANSEQVQSPELADIAEDDFNTEPPARPKTKRGDLYELNGHRMLCGDSTSIEDVARLMDGVTAHMVFTDPPYNINYTEFNANRNNAPESNRDWTDDYSSEWRDSMSDDDYQEFLNNFIANAKRHTIEYGHYYIWHATNYYRELLKALEINELPYDKVPLIWLKQIAPLSWVHYKRIHEPCLFAGKAASVKNSEHARWFGPANETTVWQINRDHNGSYIHPTQKPMALAARAIRNSSAPGETVLDLFLGSGTTLIAADSMERICRGMEMEPKFCDVIVQRFFKYCRENNKHCSVLLNGSQISENHFSEESDA